MSNTLMKMFVKGRGHLGVWPRRRWREQQIREAVGSNGRRQTVEAADAADGAL